MPYLKFMMEICVIAVCGPTIVYWFFPPHFRFFSLVNEWWKKRNEGSDQEPDLGIEEINEKTFSQELKLYLRLFFGYNHIDYGQ
jgi:hypothetical protein